MTFSPSIPNAAGSGAVGPIQFMPATAEGLKTSTIKLGKMTAIEQLDAVKKYFFSYKNRLKALEDVYMATLYPIGTGKPSNHVFFRKSTKVYDQNRGLDKNGDGKITHMKYPPLFGRNMKRIKGRIYRLTMKKILNLALLHLISISTCACTEEIDWNGIYLYEADYGKNVADTSMLVTYTLTINNNECTIEEVGYQTFEIIICHAQQDKNLLTVTFKSYDDQKLENRFGNKVYEVGTPLFTMRRTPEQLITSWKNHLPAEKPEQKGTMFSKIE